MSTTVAIDGLTFRSEPQDGDAWKLTDLSGWYSSASVTTSITNMPLSDGAFAPARAYRGSKALSLEGVTYGMTQADAISNAWETIAAIGTDGTSMDIEVTDESGTKRMTVWLSGSPQVLPFAPGRAKFQVPLVATDPRKYRVPSHQAFIAPQGVGADGLRFPLGDVSTGYLNFGTFAASGLTSLTNAGTAETWPIFLVQGAVSAQGFTIIADGDVITYVGAIAQGGFVLLSPYAGGRATNNAGQDVTPNLTQISWPSLLPKQTRTFQFISLGSASASAGMTVSVSDAFW